MAELNIRGINLNVSQELRYLPFDVIIDMILSPPYFLKVCYKLKLLPILDVFVNDDGLKWEALAHIKNILNALGYYDIDEEGVCLISKEEKDFSKDIEDLYNKNVRKLDDIWYILSEKYVCDYFYSFYVDDFFKKYIKKKYLIANSFLVMPYSEASQYNNVISLSNDIVNRVGGSIKLNTLKKLLLKFFDSERVEDALRSLIRDRNLIEIYPQKVCSTNYILKKHEFFIPDNLGQLFDVFIDILEDNKRNVKKYSTEKDLGFVQLIEDKIRCEFLDLNRNAEETKLFEYFCEKLKQCPGFRIKVKLDFLFNELIEGITRSRDTNFIHRKYKDVIDEVYDLRYITPYKVYLAYKLAQTKIKVLQSEGVFDGSKVNKKI